MCSSEHDSSKHDSSEHSSRMGESPLRDSYGSDTPSPSAKSQSALPSTPTLPTREVVKSSTHQHANGCTPSTATSSRPLSPVSSRTPPSSLRNFESAPLPPVHVSALRQTVEPPAAQLDSVPTLTPLSAPAPIRHRPESAPLPPAHVSALARQWNRRPSARLNAATDPTVNACTSQPTAGVRLLAGRLFVCLGTDGEVRYSPAGCATPIFAARNATSTSAAAHLPYPPRRRWTELPARSAPLVEGLEAESRRRHRSPRVTGCRLTPC